MAHEMKSLPVTTTTSDKGIGTVGVRNSRRAALGNPGCERTARHSSHSEKGVAEYAPCKAPGQAHITAHAPAKHIPNKSHILRSSQSQGVARLHKKHWFKRSQQGWLTWRSVLDVR